MASSVKTLKEIVESFANCRIAVLGDVMLDSYLWGHVARISPEAPVPVLNVEKSTCCLGGAANVMRNIATLGAKAYAFGVVGVDDTANLMRKSFDELNINCSTLAEDPSRMTTEKRRVVAGNQQLMRIDYEQTKAVDNSIRQQLVDDLLKLVKNHEVDAVIFEDYRKGLLDTWMLDAIIPEAKKRNIVTALDPKPGAMKPAKGLTVMKPNRLEAFAMAQLSDSTPELPPLKDENLQEVAQVLRRDWEPEQLLISLASQGMALFRDNTEVKVIPTVAREVFDVSGAGDTVTAVYTLSLCSGATPEQAAELANRAAGVVVGKVGTAPIYYNELFEQVK